MCVWIMLPIVLQIILSCFKNEMKKPIKLPKHKGRKKRIQFTPPLIHDDMQIESVSVLRMFSLDRVLIPIKKCPPDLQREARSFKRARCRSKACFKLKTFFPMVILLLIFGTLDPALVVMMSSLTGGAYAALQSSGTPETGTTPSQEPASQSIHDQIRMQ